MTKKRGFEVAKGFEDEGINLPIRATKNAAGYDFEAAEDITIPSIWQFGKGLGLSGLKTLLLEGNPRQRDMEQLEANTKNVIKPVLVPTGVKAYMGEDEYLQLCNRSGNPLKSFLVLTNGVGVIDSDYYENEGNDGHIMFQFTNFGLFPKTIKKGERIGQGIFLPFLKADNDVEGAERKGGFGSSNK